MLLAKKIKLEVTDEDATALEFMQGKCRGLYNWWVMRLRDGERWNFAEAKRSLQESRAQFEPARSMVFELSNISASSPAVEIVNMLITQGLRDRASDIHIEPQKDYLRIRFRIDGVLQDMAHLPSTTGAALTSRVKIMAGMNIVERRRAQDGQISVNVDGRELDVRVATIETVSRHGKAYLAQRQLAIEECLHPEHELPFRIPEGPAAAEPIEVRVWTSGVVPLTVSSITVERIGAAAELASPPPRS